jgi:hypothetical protein
VAVEATKNKTLNKSRQWSTFKDIEEAKCGIPVCLLSFTSRKLNGLAHGLAHLASRSGICNHWVGVVPDFIAELAMQEVVNTVME